MALVWNTVTEIVPIAGVKLNLSEGARKSIYFALHFPRPGHVAKRGPWHQRLPPEYLTRKERRKLKRLESRARRCMDSLERHAVGLLDEHRGALLRMAPEEIVAAGTRRLDSPSEARRHAEDVLADLREIPQEVLEVVLDEPCGFCPCGTDTTHRCSCGEWWCPDCRQLHTSAPGGRCPTAIRLEQAQEAKQ